MIVSIINGSPRVNGATGRILKEIERYLRAKSDVETRYYDLSKLQFALCKGCIQCYRTGTCALDDGLEEIVREIKESDAIVIGSPTYGSSVSSLLKAFIDRGHFLVEQALIGKYGFAVATYQIAEGRGALAAINKFFLIAGAGRKGSLLTKLKYNDDPLEIPGLRKQLAGRVERFYRSVKSKAGRSLLEQIFTNGILLPLVFKPAFLPDPERYSAAIGSWRAKGLM